MSRENSRRFGTFLGNDRDDDLRTFERNKYVKEKDDSERRVSNEWFDNSNSTKAQFCSHCGVKCWIAFPNDVVIQKWKCDECNTWNELDEFLGRYVAKVRKPLLSDKRKMKLRNIGHRIRKVFGKVMPTVITVALTMVILYVWNN